MLVLDLCIGHEVAHTLCFKEGNGMRICWDQSRSRRHTMLWTLLRSKDVTIS